MRIFYLSPSSGEKKIICIHYRRHGGFGIRCRHGDGAVMDVPFLVKTFCVIVSRVVNLFARYLFTLYRYTSGVLKKKKKKEKKVVIIINIYVYLLKKRLSTYT